MGRLEVTEWMKGYLGFGVTDYDAGFIKGIEKNPAARD